MKAIALFALLLAGCESQAERDAYSRAYEAQANERIRVRIEVCAKACAPRAMKRAEWGGWGADACECESAGAEGQKALK